MPHNEQTQILPALTKPNPFEEAGGILLGRQPKREFELAEIQRKIEEAGLQQKASQEKRLQQDQRLKQFSALSTIAKVINSIGPAIPTEAKSAIAQKLSDEAVTDKLMVTDKRFFDALMNQPNELSKFLDSYSQAKQQGSDDITALTASSQNLTDPEVQKLVSETFQKLVVEGVKPQKGPSVGADREALALERGFANFGEAPKDVQKAINLQVEALEKAKFGAQQQRDITNETRQLRGEFLTTSKTFVSVRDAFRRITQIAQQKDPTTGTLTAGGDLSLIFAFMKMLDPGSTVREGEQASAANAAGVPDQIRNIYNRVVVGNKLGPAQVQDFFNRANELYEGAVQDHGNDVQEFSRIAKGLGLNPAFVTPNLATVRPTPRPSRPGDRRIDPRTGKVYELRGGKPVEVKP